MKYLFVLAKLRLPVLVVLLSSSVFLPKAIGQIPAEATVQIHVNTDYDDSPQSLHLLSLLAQYAPQRQIQVVPGDTLSGLFLREYGFGPSNLPKSFKLLEDTVIRNNHLERPDDLSPGTIKIPAVPRRVLIHFSPFNAANFVANLSVFRSSEIVDVAGAKSNIGAAIKASTALKAEDITFGKSSPVGLRSLKAPDQLLEFELPVNAARELVSSTDLRELNPKFVTYPMPVRLAAVAPPGHCGPTKAASHYTLTTEQRTTIAQDLKQFGKRQSIVFILDTGWPTDSVYRESRNTLYRILDIIWRQNFGTPFRQANAETNIASPSNEHCQCIERALVEFRELDHGRGTGGFDRWVSVVYLPLTREQGATTLLTDLLQTSKLLERLAAKKVIFRQSTIAQTRKLALATVNSRLPERWVGDEVQTDASLLDAVLNVAQAYAKLSKSVFVLNESWTVQHMDWGGQYFVSFQSPQYGIVTSAVGNDPTASLLDFAQRSTNNKDTLAVMNMNAQGILAPDSTRINEQDVDNALAAGYDGLVTDEVHGTSFSAPRVAWLLAAGEAIRSRQLNLDRWTIDLFNTLHSKHKAAALGYQSLLFDPIWYLDTQVQPASP